MSELKEIQEKLDKIVKTQNTQGDQLSRLNSGLFGDKGMKMEGIAEKVEKNTRYRENSFKRWGAISGFFLALGALIGKYWNKIIQHLWS